MKIIQGMKYGSLFILLFVAIGVLGYVYPYDGTPEWVGIKKDIEKSTTVKIFKRCKKDELIQFKGNIEDIKCETNNRNTEKIKGDNKTGSSDFENIEITTIKKEQQAKSLWDWLNLVASLGIPLAVYVFQVAERKRSESRLDAEAKNVEENLCETAFQLYIDRISETLVDNERKRKIFSPEKDNCDEIDVVRIRTITILRRLNNDKERYDRVIDFLHDSDLISVIFTDAEKLQKINFIDTDLAEVNFSDSKLQGSNFSKSNLIEASFMSANLESVKLVGANLKSVVFIGADMTNADMTDADMTDAQLSGANLTNARLCGAKGLTVPQIILAKNWHTAQYDQQFREKSDFVQARNELKKLKEP